MKWLDAIMRFPDSNPLWAALIFTVSIFGGIGGFAFWRTSALETHANTYHTLIVTAGEHTWEAWKTQNWNNGCSTIYLKDGTERRVCGSYQIVDISEPHHD